jgi:predicted nucleic acid-binding protein
VRRIVVCDTGPLLHLSEANAIDLLRMAGEIVIPLPVDREFARNAPDIVLPDWVKVITLEDAYGQKADEWARHIDAGESAAIALVMQTQADWLFSDDAKARQFAQTLGVDVYSRKTVLLVGGALIAVMCFSYGFANGLTLLIIMRVVHGIGYAAATNATRTIAVDLVPPARRSEGLGYFGVAFVASLALGPALSIQIVNMSNIYTCFLAAGFIALVGLLITCQPSTDRGKSSTLPTE